MATRIRALSSALGVLGLMAGIAVPSALGTARADRSARSAHRPTHLYVSPHGSDRGRCPRRHPCRSISRAVAVASPGDEVDVAAGAYSEEVTLKKRVSLRGSHAPEIDAEGHGRGVLIIGAAAAGSSVRGFIVQGATYEGILALRTWGVTIAGNVVRHNDRGFFTGHFTGECAHNGQPGGHTADLRAGGCGEAIHLASTSNSRVRGNLVTDNTGGIYLTDESAPAAHNLIAWNVVEGNQYDCGITLASHSLDAVSEKGRPRPSAGGVYDNTITHNVAKLNGLSEPGAGILVAAAFFGSAAYGNQIIANIASDNGLPGVTLHSHGPRQDLNGNVIRDNVIGRNGLGGPHGGPGDGDAGVHHTTGIIVWSDLTHLTGITIAGNRISNDYFGIWTKRSSSRVRRSANHYRHVRVPVRQYP